MRLLGFIRGSRFISEKKHVRNLRLQLTMTPQTLAQLREHGADPDSKLRLEYFFYTNDLKKAAGLASALKSLGYSPDYGLSAGGGDSFLVTGWTPPMAIHDQTVLEWTERMCVIGFENDCEFDGWGTHPTPPEESHEPPGN